MRTLERWTAFVAVAALLLTGGLAATAASAAQDGPVRVTAGFGGLEEWRDLIQTEFIDSFNAAHPDIQLEFIYYDAGDVLRTAVQAGEGPDIITTAAPSTTNEFVAAGALAPLDAYAAEYGWQEEMLPAYYDAGIFEGSLYSLPLTHEATGTIFYNQTVFDQQGWTPPTNLAELEAICEAATAADLLCFTDGRLEGEYVNQFWIGVLLSSYAGSDFTYRALTGQESWDSPIFVETVQLFKDWMDRGWIGGGADGYFSVDWETGHALLAEGEGGMLNQGTWDFGYTPEYFAETGQEWDWFLMPALREGVERGFDLSVGTSVSINANSANPDAAAEVLDWFFNDKERASRITSQMNFGEWFVPLEWSRDELEGLGADERFLRFVDEFGALTSENRYGYSTWTFMPPKSLVYLNQGLDRVLAGDLTPQELATELQRIYAEELAAGQGMTVPQTVLTSPSPS